MTSASCTVFAQRWQFTMLGGVEPVEGNVFALERPKSAAAAGRFGVAGGRRRGGRLFLPQTIPCFAAHIEHAHDISAV
jgi:hypothetical protein